MIRGKKRMGEKTRREEEDGRGDEKRKGEKSVEKRF